MEAHSMWEGSERRKHKRRSPLFRRPKEERERICREARSIEDRLRLVNIQVEILRRRAT